jgi:hypothetical protein
MTRLYVLGGVALVIVLQAAAIWHLHGKASALKIERNQFEAAAMSCAKGVRLLQVEAEKKKRAFAESQRRLREAQVQSATLADAILSDRERAGESQCAYVERMLDEEVDLRAAR